jgi:valyl-tRNA synthetase
MLDKNYASKDVEQKWYPLWEKSGAFQCSKEASSKPYTIMMPPPNVTGSLHIGHALTFTLQDILIRYHRMKGFDTLWQPGTDHAGIATQMVVERELTKEKLSRRDMGRDKFLERVWSWKEESGNQITNQLRRLGASPDWSRERFTMDEGLSLAVRKVFVDLYNQGLIYRDKRLVNWDPKLLTAISDLEVENNEVDGFFYYINYPVQGSKDRFVTVATTRPETMFGDMAVAVHPEDDRYRDLIGKHVLLPLSNRLIPIIADTYSDPEKGTGAVKITPAHDFNDFEVGKRHKLEPLNIMDQHAHLNDNVPEAFRGLERFEARKKTIEALQEQGFINKIEPHRHTIPHGDRSGVVIEPWLMDQWYVDAYKLAQPALKAVEDGRIQFFPKHYENTYFEWLRNIQPWCISRQLWWGHRIPIWYGPNNTIFCAMDEEDAQKQAKKHFGKDVALHQDEDVLDTWFSSGLWPFSTLGWPDKTPELDRYYPTDVLVTGADIIFFWVARMIMMGQHFMGDIPFKHVYIHPLVRDEHGQKMSKTKGNVIDPLVIIDKYGADAMRFTLASLAAQGRDIKLSENRVEGNRNFVTKIWNAARFTEMNECKLDPHFNPKDVKHPLAKWIIMECVELSQRVEDSLMAYKFNEAAQSLYQFTWGTYCDWYLEFIKPLFAGEDEIIKAEIRATSAWVFAQLLHLLHPFMPYVTEELWEKRFGSPKSMLIQAKWPDFSSLEDLKDRQTQNEMDWLIRFISEIRALRSEMNVPPSSFVPLCLKDVSSLTSDRLKIHEVLLKRLARLSDITIVVDGTIPKGAVQGVLDEATFYVPLADIIDFGKEKERLSREINKIDETLQKIDQKLGNEQFVSKAPAEIVIQFKQQQEEAQQKRQKLEKALERLGQ